ncbi:uncharacterized protein LOC106652267 isoform X2 [Trichogramma pretiosum]|uniref:uncharacterized protein LOC106652267 isoform X2 n=1 Tax=Trichogramma pretiosum TaxID=7493 RepID=UPI000C719D18|nr:uncharacterized protein LOC106652267 isoform X2 [Trichogramma pretiosum]
MINMQNKQYLALCLVALVMGQAFALPQPINSSGRKIESGASNKINEEDDLDNVEDVATPSSTAVQETGNGNGFSWGGMLGMLMQMFLGQSGGVAPAGPSKNEVDEAPAPVNPWANILSVGLRVLTTLLGGPQDQGDGIDKIDNGPASPMQFINIVMNLLDALKTSFSHRSLGARARGQASAVSEGAFAAITMFQGYVKSLKGYGMRLAKDNKEGLDGCAERAICEANVECTEEIAQTGQTLSFCQIGSYVTSYLVEKRTGIDFDILHEAGLLGQRGENCRIRFPDCNAI